MSDLEKEKYNGITAKMINDFIKKAEESLNKPDTYECRCSMCHRTVFITGFICNPIICPLCKKDTNEQA